MKKKVIIIGGGLAGLSLATELVDENFDVIVLEKNGYLGGRASNTMNKEMGDPVPIGPHIFLTCYNNFLHFLNKIKAKEDIAWERKLFLEIIYKGQHDQTRMPNLAAPFYALPLMLEYKFMSFSEKFSNLRLTARLLFLNLKEIEKLDETSAYDLLVKYGVKKGAIDKIWRFFVLSMLNVPLELCSAAEFCLLVRLWARIGHRRVGFVKVGLGDLYTKKAQEYILKKGGRIVTDAEIKKMNFVKGGLRSISLLKDGKVKHLKGDVFVSALNPVDLRKILPEKILFADFFRPLNAFEGVSYISVNLWFDKKISNKKFWALLDDERTSRYMNTDFYDQSNIYNTRKDQSYITSNIIYSKAYESLTDSQIVGKTLEELKEVFPNMRAKLLRYEIHHIPYVIYAPYPGMRKSKLNNATPYKNLYITGDWTVREMTQCMESAVRSGYQCAEKILSDFGITKKIYKNRLS